MSDDLELARARMAMAKAKKRKAGATETAMGAAAEALTPEVSPQGKVGAALRGYAKGGTMGFADEAQGLQGAIINAVSRFGEPLLRTGPGRALARRMLGDAGGQLPDAAVDAIVAQAAKASRQDITGGDTAAEGYAATRDAARAEDDAAKEANPASFYTGMVGGTLLTGAKVPGLQAAKAKPFATVAQRAGAHALAGLKGGALAGAGFSEADSAGGVALDTAAGAGMGGAIGGVLGPTMEVAPRVLGPMLRRQAVGHATKAVAPTAGLTDHLRKAGMTPDEAGEAALRLGILRPLGTAKGALERLEGVREATGRAIGQTAESADELVTQGVARAPNLTRVEAVMRNRLKDAAQTGAQRQLEPAIAERLGEAVTLQGQGAAGTNTYANLWRLKSQLQRALKPQEMSKLGDELYREGVGGITKATYGELEGALGPEAIAELRANAARYGDAANLRGLLEKAVSRQGQRANIGLLDFQAGEQLGGALSQTLGPAAKPIMSGASALVRGRVNSTLATGLNAASRAVPGLRSMAPAAVSGGVRVGTGQAMDLNEEDERARAGFVTGNGG